MNTIVDSGEIIKNISHEMCTHANTSPDYAVE